MRQVLFSDFPLAEYERRIGMVRDHMAADGVDLVLLTLCESVEYLCGFTTVSWRLTDKAFWLIVPAQGPTVFLADSIHDGNCDFTCCADEVRLWGPGGTTAVDLFADILEAYPQTSSVGLEIGVRVRINMSVPDYHTVRDLLGERKVVDAAAIVGRARLHKCEEEVRRLRRACEITEEVLGEVFPAAEPGMSERDIVRDLQLGFLQRGADSPLNCNNVGYMGINGGRVLQANPTAVDRPMEQGDLLRIDGGCLYRGYGADISRLTVVGAEPTDDYRLHVDACNFVMDKTIAVIAPGVTSAQICKAAHAAISEIGYEDKRRFTMDRISAKYGSMIGHSTGYCMHEDPFITPVDETLWDVNMTGSVEFGLGYADSGYADFEDNWVVCQDGCENLSPGPRFIASTCSTC